jgi:hypothetical protein
VPKEDSLGNNSCETILGIVTPMIEGEILVAEDKIDGGIEQLRAAIKKEDGLKYDEPPGWLIPVRHSLGAVLMNNGVLPKPNRSIATISRVCQKMAGRYSDSQKVCASKRKTKRKQKPRRQAFKGSGRRPISRLPAPVSASRR